MKTLRLIALTAVCLAGSHTSAQDLIVKKDGTVIQAKVTKVGTSEVEYKKWSNQDGPQYSIAVADVLAINYKNGEKETFENVVTNVDNRKETSSATTGTMTPKEEETIESPENKQLIDLYNNQVLLPVKPKFKDKQAEFLITTFGITSNSVLSDSHITVYFSKIFCTNQPSVRGYEIRVQNKSEMNVYIDLANTFKIDDKGNSKPYYSNKTYTTNKSSSSGGSLNVGAVTGVLGIGGTIGTLANGVNVGGGSTNGTTVTEKEERILVVPPHATVTLPLEKQTNKKSIIEIPECFKPSLIPLPLDLKVHEYKDICTEQNTSSIHRRIITYSTNPDFSTYKKLNIGIFFKGIFGCRMRKSILGEPPAPLDIIGPSDLNATNWDHLILDYVSRNEMVSNIMQKVYSGQLNSPNTRSAQ